MTQGDSLTISFGLLVVLGVVLFLSLSKDWQATRAIAVLFLISYGSMLGQAVGAVLEVMP